jgi:hypothetical protein
MGELDDTIELLEFEASLENQNRWMSDGKIDTFLFLNQYSIKYRVSRWDSLRFLEICKNFSDRLTSSLMVTSTPSQTELFIDTLAGIAALNYSDMSARVVR